MRASLLHLPMFFEEEHARVAAEVNAAIMRAGTEIRNEQAAVRALGADGLFGLVVPPPNGGRLDVRALCLAREALAYASPVADSIFAVQGLAAHPLVLTGDPAHAPVLAAMRRGESIGGFALTEPEAGSDTASLRTVARREGDHWLLDGAKVFISNAGLAQHYVVFANADPAVGKRGISAFLVPAPSEGLAVERTSPSSEHPLGRLTFQSCRVPAAALLGKVGDGLRLALGTLGTFRATVGAAACGMAARAIDEAVRHVRSRRQFGVRLADFQLTQARVADMATELDAARLLVLRAAWMKDRAVHAREGATEVAMAKLFATEAAQRIVDAAVQLHGGIGVAPGSVVEELYRAVRPLRIYEGTSEIQKLLIGGSMVGAS